MNFQRYNSPTDTRDCPNCRTGTYDKTGEDECSECWLR